jgi:hypothetical protein
MSKRPTAFSILPLTISDAIAGRLLRLHGWIKAGKLRRVNNERAQILSEFNARILYDIGESDCRPLRSAAPSDNNPLR